MRFFKYMVVAHWLSIISTASIVTKQTILTPNNPDHDGVTIVHNSQSVDTDSNQWNVSFATQEGYDLLLSLDNKWGFDSINPSNITIILNGTNYNSEEGDLLIVFSCGNNQYFSVVIRNEASTNNYKVYPSPFAALNSSNVDVDSMISLNIPDRYRRISNNDQWSNPSPTYRGQAQWPIMINIENNPLLNQIKYTYIDYQTNDILYNVIYTTSFTPNNGMNIYIMTDGWQEAFGIYDININYKYQSPTTTTSASTSTINPITTNKPSISPTLIPTLIPTNIPTIIPTVIPTKYITEMPTYNPSDNPTYNPSGIPTKIPTIYPTSQFPTQLPTNYPTVPAIITQTTKDDIITTNGAIESTLNVLHYSNVTREGMVPSNSKAILTRFYDTITGNDNILHNDHGDDVILASTIAGVIGGLLCVAVCILIFFLIQSQRNTSTTKKKKKRKKPKNDINDIDYHSPADNNIDIDIDITNSNANSTCITESKSSRSCILSAIDKKLGVDNDFIMRDNTLIIHHEENENDLNHLQSSVDNTSSMVTDGNINCITIQVSNDDIDDDDTDDDDDESKNEEKEGELITNNFIGDINISTQSIDPSLNTLTTFTTSNIKTDNDISTTVSTLTSFNNIHIKQPIHAGGSTSLSPYSSSSSNNKYKNNNSKYSSNRISFKYRRNRVARYKSDTASNDVRTISITPEQSINGREKSRSPLTTVTNSNNSNDGMGYMATTMVINDIINDVDTLNENDDNNNEYLTQSIINSDDDDDDLDDLSQSNDMSSSSDEKNLERIK